MRFETFTRWSNAPLGRSVHPGCLPDLDQVAVRVAEVAPDLGGALLWRGEELGSASGPFLVDRLDVRDADVQEGAHAIGVRWGLERDRRLVLGGPAADVDDDPAVRERDERRLAGPDRLAAEHVRVEAARSLDVRGDDEMGQDDPFLGYGR